MALRNTSSGVSNHKGKDDQEKLTMMQCRQPRHVRPIHRTVVVEEQLHHRNGANGRGTVQRQRPSLVFHTRSSLLLNELPGSLEIVFGGAEVEGSLPRSQTGH